MTTYIHLDESVRHLAEQDDLTRAKHILKDVFIYHGQARRILQYMNVLLNSPRRYRPNGVFICGGPGTGKTAQLRAFERAHPPFSDGAGARKVPVVYVEMDEEPSPRTMYKEILEAVGVPWNAFPGSMPARTRVVKALTMLDTRLLMVDEVANMCDDKREAKMAKWLRMLTHRLRIPVILAGTDKFKEVLNADLQMSSRWPFVIELPLWTDTSEFELLLTSWQRILPLRSPSDLTKKEIRVRLLQETGGITDNINRCLMYAAITAIRLKHECITADLLSWWRDPPMLSGTTEDPDNVATAWLADTRTTPDPLQIYPVATMQIKSLTNATRKRQVA